MKIELNFTPRLKAIIAAIIWHLLTIITALFVDTGGGHVVDWIVAAVLPLCCAVLSVGVYLFFLMLFDDD